MEIDKYGAVLCPFCGCDCTHIVSFDPQEYATTFECEENNIHRWHVSFNEDQNYVYLCEYHYDEYDNEYAYLRGNRFFLPKLHCNSENKASNSGGFSEFMAAIFVIIVIAGLIGLVFALFPSCKDQLVNNALNNRIFLLHV